MVITSTGGRPQLRFYLSIVIQIGENIPTNQGQLKNFRPIIKSLTSGDWSVIRILRDLRSGVGWRLGWWPAQWPGDLELARLAALSLMRGMLMWSRPSQRIVFQDTSSERGRERESGADGKMLLLYLLLAPITEPSRPLHNGKLSGGNLKLAPISLSLWPATQSQAQVSQLRSNQLLLGVLPLLLLTHPALSHHSTASTSFSFQLFLLTSVPS